MGDYPFHWVEGGTVTISATSTSAPTTLLKMPSGLTQIRVANKGPNTVFIRKGTDLAPATATTADYPILAGVTEVLTIRNVPAAPITHIAAICASTETATLYVTTGIGD